MTYHQCSTFSKHPLNFPANFPVLADRGLGQTVEAYQNADRTGPGQYIDWMWSGAGVLGRAHPEIQRAVTQALTYGTAFGLPTVAEQEASETLLSVLPDWAERVRWGLTGTGAVAAAVRLARAVTGRDDIIIFDPSYHGASADWFYAGEEPARGFPKYENITYGNHPIAELIAPHKIAWNKPRTLLDAVNYHTPAAVVFEVRDNPTDDMIAALNGLKDKGIVLIADEVVTGFRLHLQGACGLWGIEPDLACYGKALGSGMPVSALVGRRELMDEFDLAVTNTPVFSSYTHAGDPICVLAAKKTIEILRDSPVLQQIWRTGENLWDAFYEAARANYLDTTGDIDVKGQPPRHSFVFRDKKVGWLWQQEMAERQVLMGTTNCPMLETRTSRRPELKWTLKMMAEVMPIIAKAVHRGTTEGLLKGREPRPAYSQDEEFVRVEGT